MALVVTPGGSADNAYVALARAEAIWDEIGFDYSSYDQAAKESALSTGAYWMDGEYMSRYPGKATNGRDQSMGFPRTGAKDIDLYLIDSSTIPREIEYGNAIVHFIFNSLLRHCFRDFATLS